jgi:Fe-Mn family superoxide dismutase
MYPFELPPLPYAYDALEPYIDAETMHYHHDKHYQTYIDNLNNALKSYPALQRLTLEQLLLTKALPAKDRVTILNNAGGVYNHMHFFNGLRPANEEGHLPDERLMSMINNTFGSFGSFKDTFSKQALAVFGSGWTCLALTRRRELKIINLANQATTLEYGAVPLILFDVWEHAYYLKYRNLRSEYVDNIWNVITFPQIQM